jgi:hypothetical protein
MMTLFCTFALILCKNSVPLNTLRLILAKQKLFLSSEKLLTFNCVPYINFFFILNHATISALIIYSLMF